jgi:hypothetical protein
MKQFIVIDQLHRRRLNALESALKHARADQAECEAVWVKRCRAEVATRERGLAIKHDIDAVLFIGAVKQSDLCKVQHLLQAAKDALLAARGAVETARVAVAASERRTEVALQAWREQAVTVEKFGAIRQRAQDEHNAEMLYREEMELEDVSRRRA